MPENNNREFRPELMPRRSEFNAWVMAIVVLVSLLILIQTLENVPVWSWMFCGFLIFSAFSISLGNWMDRKTKIRLDTNGINFENGLRRSRLDWHEVQSVAILPARWGKRVQVIGEKTHFDFKTLGKVEFQGTVRGQTGFSEGLAILDIILRETGLVLIEESHNAYYYARA